MLFRCCLAFIFADDKLFCKESVFSLWLTLRLSISGVLWFLSDVSTCGFAFIYLAEVLGCFFSRGFMSHSRKFTFIFFSYLSSPFLLNLTIWIYMYLNYHHILFSISVCLKWKGSCQTTNLLYFAKCNIILFYLVFSKLCFPQIYCNPCNTGGRGHFWCCLIEGLYLLH